MLIHPSSRGSCPFIPTLPPLSPHSLPPTTTYQPKPYVGSRRGAFIQLTSVATPAVSYQDKHGAGYLNLYHLALNRPEHSPAAFTIHSQLLPSTSAGLKHSINNKHRWMATVVLQIVQYGVKYTITNDRQNFTTKTVLVNVYKNLRSRSCRGSYLHTFVRS
jgi:hypothetical protein